MLSYDDRRWIPPEEQDRILNFAVLEDVFLCRQIEQYVCWLCRNHVNSSSFVLRQERWPWPTCCCEIRSWKGKKFLTTCLSKFRKKHVYLVVEIFIITRSVYYQVKFRQRLIKEQYFKQNEAGSLLTGHSFFFSEEIDDLDHCLLWCLLQCWNQGARLLVVFWHQVPDEDIVSVSDQFTFRVHILLIP